MKGRNVAASWPVRVSPIEPFVKHLKTPDPVFVHPKRIRKNEDIGV